MQDRLSPEKRVWLRRDAKADGEATILSTTLPFQLIIQLQERIKQSDKIHLHILKSPLYVFLM